MEKSGYRPNILNWAKEDRPREKLLLKGKDALSDAELIGILLGSGTREINAVDLARHILQEVDNDLYALARFDVKDLQKFKGVGEAKAITIISALELGRRRKTAEFIKKPKITCSNDAYICLSPYLLDKITEEFWILILNKANKVIASRKISQGGTSGTVADPKIIFKTALDERGSSIILAHNHPSGNIQASGNDIKLTKKLKLVGESLDLPVLDHIIFSDEHYFSFADEGIL
ncbi:MAG: hypothetical protein DRH21_03305 [Deltaproteobacteria bacterium]|nr:MAG: hypothetical protein DRH21_03305 [Deltaproteobacteria bacterium]